MPDPNQTGGWSPQIAQVAQSSDERMAYIRGLIQDGRSQEAQAELAAVAQAEPDNVRCRLTLGYVLMQDNQLESAAAAIEEAMAIDPRNESAPLLAAAVGMRGNNPEYAEAQFQKALQINPSSQRALTGLARLHEQQKRPEEVIRVLDHALGLNPHSPQLRQQMARAMGKLDRTDEAIQHLEYAAEANPDNVFAIMALARTQMQNGKPAMAVKTIEAAIDRNSESAQLFQMLGSFKTAGGDHAGAEEALTQALALAGKAERRRRRDIDNLRLALVRSLIPQKKYTDARAHLSKVRQRNLMSFVHRLYGDCFVAEGRTADAEMSFRAAMAATPDGREALKRVDAAKAELAADGNVLDIYEAEFKGLRESWEAKMRERAETGPSPEQQEAMRARFQRQRGQRRRASAAGGQGANPGQSGQNRWGIGA
ncbi:MAG: tetratricopeptide repeat protein [Marinibacterium sp.]